MILDRLENALLYRGLSPRMAKALEMVRTGDILSRPNGRYELDGDRIFVMVQEYSTRPREQAAWEAHRRYIDIQCITEGSEIMGHTHIASLAVTTPYDDAKDVMFLAGDGNFVRVDAGSFVIFHPHDAHMPTIAPAAPAKVRKAVFKVMVD